MAAENIGNNALTLLILGGFFYLIYSGLKHGGGDLLGKLKGLFGGLKK